MKKKLESIVARLNKLCSEICDDAVWDGNEHQRRANLFEWVVRISPYLKSC